MIVLRTALALAMMLVAALPCAGQETARSEEGAETFKVLKSYYRQKAKQYEFTLDAEGKHKLVLQPVAMTYTGHDYQSVANTVAANSGEVYIWTYEGRAIVAGGIGSFPAAGFWDFFHEFHVLTEHAPQPTKINSLADHVWRPEGETPRLIPGAPAPDNASSPSLAKSRRLKQMRELAQGFSGTTVKPDDSGNVRLRLLPAPIYRLDPADLANGHHTIIDGAVFVFTGQDGTDAEMLLSIECREGDSGLEWTYVPAAMTYLEMWMEHQGKEVWHIPNYRTDERMHNYFTAGWHCRVARQCAAGTRHPSPTSRKPSLCKMSARQKPFHRKLDETACRTANEGTSPGRTINVTRPCEASRFPRMNRLLVGQRLALTVPPSRSSL